MTKRGREMVAARGGRRVKMDVIRMPPPYNRFPPYFSASLPPGSWVTTYPKKNAPSIHPCSLAPQAKGPSGGGPSVELAATGHVELSITLELEAMAVLLTMATMATERLPRMA